MSTLTPEEKAKAISLGYEYKGITSTVNTNPHYWGKPNEQWVNEDKLKETLKAN